MSRSDNHTTKMVLDCIIQHQPCKVSKIVRETGLTHRGVISKLITIESQGTLLTEDEHGNIALYKWVENGK